MGSTLRHQMLALVGLLAALSSCDGCRERLLPPPPENSGPVAYEPGLVPAELRTTFRWPFPPMVDEEVVLTANSAINTPWTQSGVRLKVDGQLQQLIIDADDVEIVGHDAMYIESLIIMPGSERIRVVGGQYGQIVLEAPLLVEPPPEWRAPDMIQDVLIENVNVMAMRSGLSGVLVRGKRVAIVSSRIDAQFAAVHVGDTAPVLSEDIVIIDCSLYGGGEEPTVDLRDVKRAMVMHSWIENPRLAGLRIHGESEWVFASVNTLVGGGVEIAPNEGDLATDVWFWINTMHHTTGDPVKLGPDRIRELVLSLNLIYSDFATCAWCGRAPESWQVEQNTVRRYRAPPARP